MLCHKQSVKEQVQGKVDKYILTWWKYLGCHIRKSRKEIPDGENMTHIINWINYHEYEHNECNDWKKASTTSVNMCI